MTAETAYLEQVSKHIARDALPHLNLADYRFSGMCDDRHLPEDLAQLFASLPELPKKLGRSAQAVFIELHQNISRYGYRHRPDAQQPHPSEAQAHFPFAGISSHDTAR